MDELKDLNEGLMKEAIELAKEHKKVLHEIPEKAMEEHKTTAYIKEVIGRYPVELIDLGMETVALRADIDALPTEYGDMHLCGHDGHAGGLLGAMHYLANVKDTLPCNVLFIFQPAEEGTQGARAMIDHGMMDKIPVPAVRLFGIHNRPEVPCGDVVVHKGPLMSEKTVFRTNFKGRTAHGSTPHKSIDPIVAACSYVMGLQTVMSRNIDPFATALCAVNCISAGKPDNPSPENALVTGYLRSFDKESDRRMKERIVQLAEGTADAYGCECDVELIPVVPVLDNSEEMYGYAYRAVEMALGAEHIVDSEATLASEDFSVLGEYIPSFFYWVGSGEIGEHNASWHEMDFRIGRDYFEAAVPVLVASVLV